MWMLVMLIACGSEVETAANASSEVSKASQTKKKDRREAAERRQIERARKAREANSKSLKQRKAKASETREKLGLKEGGTLSAVFVTSMGDIKCELLPDVAPVTVLNFVQLSEGTREWTHPGTRQTMNTPLYSGTIFHRVIPKFMIQGGDPLGRGTGNPGYRFEDEPHPDHTFNRSGILAMANSGPNTNGSQFFITDRSKPKHLNGKHTIFGYCDNLDVVQAIADVPTARSNRPQADVVLKKVKILR